LTHLSKPDIIVNTISANNDGEVMSTAILDRKTKRELTVHDRCDTGCGSQAFVKVKGKTGELVFCSHHYNKITKSADGYLALSSFATKTIDEREFVDQRSGD